MWKAAILFLTLRLYGISGGNIYRNEWAQAQIQPVNQPSYYSQYGPLLHDFTSYQEKLHQQGFAPAYGQDLNPPFILTNNAAVDSYNPYPYNVHHETSDNHNLPSYHSEYPTTHRPPCTKRPTTAHSTGKHKFNHIVKTDNKNEKENAKKPIHESDVKRPPIKHDNHGDKQHANRSIVNNLNATRNKISGGVQVRVSAIKQFIDKSVDNINKTADGVYQQISSDSSWVIDRINKKLKGIEKQLERLKFGSVKRMDDEEFEDDDASAEDFVRSIPDNNPSTGPNVVHSEIGKKLRSMELLDMNAELRGDLKTSISDAVKSAQDKFNKLIDDQVSRINKKITDITLKFEGAFNKFQETVARTPAPTKPATHKPTVSSEWKPKATTPYPSFNTYVTPDYFKYTIPSDKYKQEAFEETSDASVADLNRMDANVDALEIVDDAKSELAKSDDDLEKISAAEKIDNKASMNGDKEKDLKLDDELKIDVDTAKSLDDLQSQVLANVKVTLKSDVEDLEAIENNQSEVLENPEDKLKSDMAESDIETALTEELRRETEEDKLLANSDIVDSEVKYSDDLAETADESEGETTAQSLDGSVKSLEIDEDDDDDGIDMLSSDAPIDSEDSRLTEPNQAGSFRFDELEIISLIPVIIEELRSNHVSESEQLALEKIFGDLWPMLVVEAGRKGDEKMNPVLETIILSEEVRHPAKRDIIKRQIGNDIYKNSVRRVFHGADKSSTKPYLALDDDRKLLSPSERLLKMVAAIVYKSNEKRSSDAKVMGQKQRRRNVRKKARKNPLGIVSVEKPRQRFADRILSINRIKRSIVKFTSDLEDMKSFLEQVNQANDSEEDEEVNDNGSASNEHLDDYVDDEYYYDDDYQMSPESGYPLNKLSWNQRNYFDDYENGSVNEFIQLAKQRDRREKSENFDENYEDDDYQN